MPIKKPHIPENLGVVMAHLRAVRALTKYADSDSGGIWDDWDIVHKYLKQEIEWRHPHLSEWGPGEHAAGKTKWQPPGWGGVGICLGIYTPSPIDDANPDAYAFLEVGEECSKSKARKLEDRLRELQKPKKTFEHIEDYREQDYEEGEPAWVWVQYERFFRSARTFDWSGFLQAVVEAFEVLLALQPEIDKIISASGKPTK